MSDCTNFSSILVRFFKFIDVECRYLDFWKSEIKSLKPLLRWKDRTTNESLVAT